MSKILRRAGYVAGGLVGVLAVAAGGVFGVSSVRINKAYAIEQPPIAIPTDSASVERGRHIATAITKCVDCHGANLGGKTFFDGQPVATLYSANLTRGQGGIGATYTDADWLRALKHGVRRDGKSVLFMPSQEFSQLSDEDLGALIAYLKQLPAVDYTPGENVIGPVGRALHLAGQLPLLPAELIDHERVRAVTAPPAGPTAEYGRYLADVGGCKGCHGAELAGGRIPGTPPDWKPAANLTPTGIGHYTEADMVRLLREGKRPDGSTVDSLMPYRLTKLMTDDEIKAVYAFLKTVPAKPYPGN